MTEQYYYEEDQELPPFHIFTRSYAEDIAINTYVLQQAAYNRPNDNFLPHESRELSWLLEQFAQRILIQHYDYQNLYNPFCDTAIYYFLEDIVIDFDDMEEDDSCYPFGWFDFFAYCDKIGVKLPTYGDDGGKYGKSIMWG